MQERMCWDATLPGVDKSACQTQVGGTMHCRRNEDKNLAGSLCV